MAGDCRNKCNTVLLHKMCLYCVKTQTIKLINRLRAISDHTLDVHEIKHDWTWGKIEPGSLPEVLGVTWTYRKPIRSQVEHIDRLDKYIPFFTRSASKKSSVPNPRWRIWCPHRNSIFHYHHKHPVRPYHGPNNCILEERHIEICA